MQNKRFRKLCLSDKLATIRNHGIWLMTLNGKGVSLRLFALENFYVEITSNKKTNKVISINDYTDIFELDHILEAIDISVVTR